MVDFIIEEGWNCEDIKKIIEEYSIAEIYPSWGGEAHKIKNMLLERKKELGWTD